MGNRDHRRLLKLRVYQQLDLLLGNNIDVCRSFIKDNYSTLAQDGSTNTN